MTDTGNPATRLAVALADRYRIERELGAGGMANELVASATYPAAIRSAPIA